MVVSLRHPVPGSPAGSSTRSTTPSPSCPSKTVGAEVSVRPTAMQSQAFGVTSELLDVADCGWNRDRYITDEDLNGRSRCASSGSEVKSSSSGSRIPLGANLRIDSQVFPGASACSRSRRACPRRNGVRSWWGGISTGRAHPLTTAESQFGNVVMRRTAGSFSVRRSSSPGLRRRPNTDTVLNVAEGPSGSWRLPIPGSSTLESVLGLLENAKALMTWNVMLIAIAAISLLVGGIGIMNIMLATVTERTRKSASAGPWGRQNHIILQFLVGNRHAGCGRWRLGIVPRRERLSMGLRSGGAGPSWLGFRTLSHLAAVLEPQVTMVDRGELPRRRGGRPCLRHLSGDRRQPQDPIIALRHDWFRLAETETMDSSPAGVRRYPAWTMVTPIHSPAYRQGWCRSWDPVSSSVRRSPPMTFLPGDQGDLIAAIRQLRSGGQAAGARSVRRGRRAQDGPDGAQEEARLPARGRSGRRRQARSRVASVPIEAKLASRQRQRGGSPGGEGPLPEGGSAFWSALELSPSFARAAAPDG